MEASASNSEAILPEPGPAGGAGGPRRAEGFRIDTPTEILFLVIGTIAVLLPFSTKPLHIDDPLFVWTAKQIQQHPTDFYGFDVNWYGWSQPMHVVNQNPPGAAYYLALWSPLTGFSEAGMHLTFLLPNLALVLGTYVLAKRFCGRPLLATIAACGSPAVLISATTLMSDTLMAACWCWAMVLWLEGLDRRSLLCFLAAGVLAAAAALTKYFGACVVPLLVAYTIVRDRRLGWWLLGVAVPAAALAAYELWARHLYGHGLLVGAASYASEFRQDHDRTINLFNAFLFLGGGLLTIGFAAVWLWPRRVVFAVVVAMCAGFAIWNAAISSPFDTHRDMPTVYWLYPLHGIVLLLAAINIVALAVVDPFQRRNADSLLLALWFGGTFLFVAVINWTVTSRTLVPLAPVAGILFARRLEWWQQHKGRAGGEKVLAAAIGVGVTISLILAWADATFARTQKLAARTIVDFYSASSQAIWFEGHWGLQYYLEQAGAQPLDIDRAVLKGDIVILPQDNTNVKYRMRPVATPIRVAPFERAKWVATVAISLRTNFYAAEERASLPFLFGPVPPDRYRIDQVQSSVRTVEMRADEAGGDQPSSYLLDPADKADER